jgi:hypothetical protein
MTGPTVRAGVVVGTELGGTDVGDEVFDGTVVGIEVGRLNDPLTGAVVGVSQRYWTTCDVALLRSQICL